MPAKFNIQTGKHIKRRSIGRGGANNHAKESKVLGHSRGPVEEARYAATDPANKYLGYVEARKNIYLPAYAMMLDELVKHEMEDL